MENSRDISDQLLLKDNISNMSNIADDLAKSRYDLLKNQLLPLPPPPPVYHGPITGYPFVITPPPPYGIKDDFVFIGNRDNFQPKWYRVGSPLSEAKNSLGSTSYNLLSKNQNDVISGSHHNQFLPTESTMSDNEIREKLQSLNLPSEGSREEIFKRLINSKEIPLFQQKIADRKPLNEDDLAILENPNIYKARQLKAQEKMAAEQLAQNNAARTTGLLRDAAEARANNVGRIEAIDNVQLDMPPMEARANPMLANQSSNILMNASGEAIANNQNLRNWGKQNLANQAQAVARSRQVASLDTIAANESAMATAARNGAARTAIAQRAAATGLPATAAGATFASRALPMLNMVLLGSALLQNSQANKQRREQNQLNRSMRT